MAVQTQIDSRFHDAARYVQEGSWRAALNVLQDLVNEYPNQKAEIAPLLEHVQMKARLESKKVRGRTMLEFYFNRQRVTKILIGVLVFLLAVGGWWTYTNMVVPALQRQSQRALIESLLVDARAAQGSAEYSVAAELYRQILELRSDSEEARSGLEQVERQIELATLYDTALESLRQGNGDQALAELRMVQEKQPGYRETEKLIDQILRNGELGSLYAQAESYYSSRNWFEAIPLYIRIRQANVNFEADSVESHLFTSYVQLADETSLQGGLGLGEIEAVAQLYGKALSLRPRERSLRSREQHLTRYLQSVVLFDNHEYATAVEYLAEIFTANPQLLGGEPIQLLYDARLGYGAQLEQSGNLWSALAQYMAAADLPLDDISEAQLRARTVGLALTPTVTPTPTATPTPTPDPIDGVLKLLPPTPAPIENYMGWIAFKSNRPTTSSSNLWAMPPEGGQAMPVADPNDVYKELKLQARWSNDFQRRIWVESDGGHGVAIYMRRYDVPAHWLDARVELLNNSAVNYQPAYSPDNQSIVFTSQRPKAPVGSSYGDEIFVFHFADFNEYGHVVAQRLTDNDWEWDKHPTFSPDSQQIAFWSNRGTGRAQIWIMNKDGSNQRNISNSEWADWDPVFIVPLRDKPEEAKKEDEEDPEPPIDPSALEVDR